MRQQPPDSPSRCRAPALLCLLCLGCKLRKYLLNFSRKGADQCPSCCRAFRATPAGTHVPLLFPGPTQNHRIIPRSGRDSHPSTPAGAHLPLSGGNPMSIAPSLREGWQGRSLPHTRSCPTTPAEKGLPISAAPSDAVPSRLLWRNVARRTFPLPDFPVSPSRRTSGSHGGNQQLPQWQLLTLKGLSCRG